MAGLQTVQDEPVSHQDSQAHDGLGSSDQAQCANLTIRNTDRGKVPRVSPIRRRNPPRGFGRRIYRDDDSDPHYDHFTEMESDGVLDPDEDTALTEDEIEETSPRTPYEARLHHVANSALGDTLPFLLFPRHLQAAGYGEIPLPGAIEGDIDNGIHKIFRQANWIREARFGEHNIDENDLLWQRMQPALRLATKFITDPNVLHWHVRTLDGRKLRDKETKREYMSVPAESGEASIRRVRNRFDDLVRRVRWQFAQIRGPAPGHQTHGLLAKALTTLDNHCLPRNTVLPHTEPNRAFHIAVNECFRTYFLSDTYDPENEPCRVLQTNWFFAITIVHELAHVLYASKPARPSFKEPYFNLFDTQAEMGWSWEASILGNGELQGYVDPDFGAVALQWEPAIQPVEEPSVNFLCMFKWPLDPLWIYRFFLKDTWNQLQQQDHVEKMRFWFPPHPCAAVTSAPKRRGEGYNYWIWVTQDASPEHRLSMQYWQHKNQDWAKRKVEEAKIERAKRKQERENVAYRPGGGRRKSRKKAREKGILVD